MINEHMIISKETEEKRLDDFKRLSENWDNLPDYAAGKLDGIISAFAMFYLDSEKKAG
ncbi:hypothetical protein C817_05487 [Dorea sp. 5-2]|nr:hypothetical protein C817_05487 [Dorea sp. 5-2]